MPTITYTYKGTEKQAKYKPIYKSGELRFQITVDMHEVFILPAGIPAEGDATIWVQEVVPKETVYDHEFIQALGDAIEQFEK